MTRLATLLALMLVAAGTVRAGTPDIPDEINARLARSKTLAATESAAARAAPAVVTDGAGGALPGGIRTLAAGALGNGCNIAIGNIFEDTKPGTIGTSARRETTVIVTGDVIQVGNNCR